MGTYSMSDRPLIDLHAPQLYSRVVSAYASGDMGDYLTAMNELFQSGRRSLSANRHRALLNDAATHLHSRSFPPLLVPPARSGGHQGEARAATLLCFAGALGRGTTRCTLAKQVSRSVNASRSTRTVTGHHAT